ncbi:peptide ABC transporter substrate-binding protein [uncultured Megasphaera sp.]|uniref:peptide ABC transporter substrate-binding protein n=1 Tax=uncultured Megasphaera sp. TaxID=165188 RepID=UPI0025D3BC34|nr:peptide ABC transporter substrate-binding protein [uncultured Megasphaera sp.]
MKKIWILLMCLLMLVLSGCSTEKNDTVSYALEAEPASLDPAMTTGLAEANVQAELFEGLTRLDRDNQPQPALAERWDISPDGKTYTFHLRPGITWSDGTPITAHDFVYSWMRVIDPAVASPNAYMMFIIDGAEAFSKKQGSAEDVGIKAPDDRTLQVRLKNPTAYFLNLTSFHCYYPVPEALVRANPDTWAANAGGFVGCGPFTLEKWIHSSEITVKKNPAYWDAGHVRSDYLDFPISESQSTRLTLVESGQANMMVEPPPAEQQRLESLGLYQVAPYLGTYYYVFNTQKAPFDDVRVRKAFALAMEREGLVKHIVRGRKEAAYAWVPPGMKNPATGQDFRKEGGNLQEENAEQAQQLLKEAGYDESHQPEVTILFNTNEMHKAVAEAVQAMWKKNLGVQVELTNQEAKVYLASRTQGNYQVARASWVADYADPMTFLDVFADEDNDAQYHNEAYLDRVRKAKEEKDPGLRMQYMHQAEQILFDDCVLIPIYYTTQPFVVQPYVKGYHWSPLGLIDLKEAYIEK